MHKIIENLGLYIHLPWCLSKCPYCDFNSYPKSKTQALPADLYVECLQNDLQHDLSRINKKKLTSIYIGGGTPSLFPTKAIAKIIDGVRKETCFTFDSAIEISMEANPGTINKQTCQELLQGGINRLSVGVQSFQRDRLIAIGRIHDEKKACAALEAVNAAGFNNYNIDLMFGLPGQTVADALFDLEIALSFAPTHISWYQLTIEEGSRFYNQPPKALPASEIIWEMQQQGQQFLKDAGFTQYEISAYSKQGYQCEHNVNYWEFGDYLGIGAGAHSKITDRDSGVVRRFWKFADPIQYMQNQVRTEAEKIISHDDLPLEFMLNALRLYKPIPVKLFIERTGMDIHVIKDKLQKACDLGLIKLTSTHIETTTRGRNFLNDLLEIFLYN